MIVVTGAAGFIGSCVAISFKLSTEEQIVIVDDFSREDKFGNLNSVAGCLRIERSNFLNWAKVRPITGIIHLGARTDTTEFNEEIFKELNLEYSKSVWRLCVEKQIPLIYASSAATYGDGSFGYVDDHNVVEDLKPLNPYGVSKNEFDKWVLNQISTPPRWYGLKFFNVYGPNEYHKGRMASVIFHAFNQIKNTSALKLFRSHNPDYQDGGQMRDFVYVKDVVDVIAFLYNHQVASGIYNLGSGVARTFNDLGVSVFHALNKDVKIDFIDTPLDIRDKYQYFTEADMGKLRKAGYVKPFTTLEKGVSDYVLKYLVPEKHYLP